MKFIECKLTATQQQAWVQTKTMLMWRAPGYNHLFVTMLNPNQNDGIIFWSRDCPTLATDGQRIIANPEYFFALDIFQRVFACCHEIGHAMFKHCEASYTCLQRGTITVRNQQYPFDPKIANYAQDYIINDLQVHAKLGRIKPGWLHDPSIGTQHDAWPDVYVKLLQDAEGGGGAPDGEGEGEAGDDEQEGSGGPGEPQEGQGDGKQEDPQFDWHMKPGEASGQTPQEGIDKSEAMTTAWKQAIAVAAKLTAEALERGNGSAELLKFFEQFLQPVVTWVDLITGTFAKRVGSGSYDYRKPDRRLIVRDIYAPSRSGHGARTIVVASDTSGSIFAVPRLLERFFGEMSGIIGDCKPVRVIVLWVDAQVKRVAWIDDILDLEAEWQHGAEGGGGTSFEPAFDWMKANEIDDCDAMVYLTDLQGTFPPADEEPYYPVIWATINHDKDDQANVPFGEIVEIPADGSA